MGQILNYDTVINARASGQYQDVWMIHSHAGDDATDWSWQYITPRPVIVDGSWIVESEFRFSNGRSSNHTFSGIQTLALGGKHVSANDTGFGPTLPPILPPSGGRQRWITAAETTLRCYGSIQAYDLLWLCKHAMNTASATGASPTLRRYADGDGVQILAHVSYAAMTTVPETTVTVTYVNQDGVAGRTATGVFKTVAKNGTCAASMFCSQDNKKVPMSPFLALQAGDSGVRSITGIALSSTGNTTTMIVALVKPLFSIGPRLGGSQNAADLLARPEGPVELVVGSDGQHGAINLLFGIYRRDYIYGGFTGAGMTRIATVEV